MSAPGILHDLARPWHGHRAYVRLALLLWTGMDAADSSMMAGHMTAVVNAFYETVAPIAMVSPSSLAEADRNTDETGRSGVPWGSLPAETFQSIVASTSRAVADHLHSTAHLLRADIDFGPMVMARSIVEASGRIAWLLPPGSDIRERVGRGYALRVIGLRDNAKNLDALVALANPCPRELAAAAEEASQRVGEVLARAHALGFKTFVTGRVGRMSAWKASRNRQERFSPASRCATSMSLR